MREFELSLDELEEVIDEIISEGIVSTIDEELIESILYGDDNLDEDMSSAVDEFLSSFDKKASATVERKTLEKLAKKHGVNPKELVRVVGAK